MPEPHSSIHPSQAARLSVLEGLQIREDVAYCNDKGEEKKAVRQRAEKAVAKLREPLSRVLEKDEVILYVARVQAPVNPWEQLTFGWYIYYVTGTVLVITNRRLLHFLVTRDGSWKKSLRAVRWGDVAEAKVKGWLSQTLQLKYGNGAKETYWNLRRDDAKKIKLLLSVLLPEAAGRTTPAGAMVSLCPTCLAALTPRVYQCAQCHLAFKDEGSLTRRALLIPGGGYFYTGHWFLAVADFIVEAYLLVVFLGLLFMVLTENNDASLWLLLAFIGFLLALEKLLSIHHCRRFVREFMPAEGGVRPIGKAALTLSVVFFVAILGLVWLGWSEAQEPVRVVQAHLDALNHKDYAGAYSYLSHPLQAKLPLDAFEQYVQENEAVFTTSETRFPVHEVSGDAAKVCGPLTSEHGGEVYACYGLVREEDHWAINGLKLGTDQ